MSTSERTIRFERLYVEHLRPVSAYCIRRLPDRVDAEDAAAEVFSIAWRRLDRVPLGQAELPWLYGVARRVVATAIRTRTRRDRLVARVTRLPLGEAPPPADSGSAVRDALSRLRPADREVLMLSAWEGLAAKDVAAVLHCSPNAAAIRLHRARERLREQLADVPHALDAPRRSS